MSHLFSLITQSPVLTSLVIVAVIALVIVEAITPLTFGILGLFGFGVLATLLYAYQVTGIGYWFGPVFVVVGSALVITELVGFHVHGFMMTIGAACVGIGMYYALGASTNAGIATSAGIAATFCALFFVLKTLPFSGFWRKSGSDFVLHMPVSQSISLVEPGTSCIAASDLRPCGMVMIGEHQLPARCINGYARNGSQVTVIEHRTRELIVSVNRG